MSNRRMRNAVPSEPEPRPSLSVVVLTLNEEERIGRTLESVRWADEIVVVDSGSTDRTEAIAHRYTDRFYVMPWEGEGRQRQRALELATGDWVLTLDADEVVSPELRRSIERALRDPGSALGFKIEYRTWFLGEWFGGRGWRRDRKLRLFRRDRARYDAVAVHSRVAVDGPPDRLSGPLLHYHYRGLEQQVQKINRYTSWSAQQAYEQGKRCGAFTPIVRLGTYFGKSYLLHGGFLYGRAGLVDAVLEGVYGFLKYAKLWELANADRMADPMPGEEGEALPGPNRGSVVTMHATTAPGAGATDRRLLEGR